MGLACICMVSLSNPVRAEDSPQWGERNTRNMISPEKNMPETFDVQSGAHIAWTADLGNSAYSSPVVANGKVFIGANNAKPRDAARPGDRAVLLCLNEKDGALCWQLAVPKIGGDKFLDWPEVGMCSPPTIEDGRIYTVTNRCEVVCLDINGMANGNDGPFKEEAALLSSPEAAPVESPLDADILWKFDLRTQAGTYPHDAAHVSVVIDGPVLYLNTSNGVDNSHARIPCPQGPCLIALDKATGRMLSRENEGIAQRIFHSTWAPPSLRITEKNKQVIFGGPDGVVYAFQALTPPVAEGPLQPLTLAWRFDCDPEAPKKDVHLYLKKENSPSTIKGMPVLYKDRVYVTAGGDIWFGKRQASLKCIDATGSGDITQSALRWSFPLEKHACSTPAIVDNLVFVTDCGGNIHCIDAETGAAYWKHMLGGEIWGSALVADGKVYVGSRDGDFAILAATKELRVIAQIKIGIEVASTATAANSTLYVPTLEKLFAIR